MKVDLQNFRYQHLKNIKMDDFLEENLLLLLLLRRQREKRALGRALKFQITCYCIPCIVTASLSL